DYVKVNDELKAYDRTLIDRPQLIVANKMDMPQAEENLQKFKQSLPKDVQIYPISAITKQGLRELLYALADLLDDMPKYAPQMADEQALYRQQEEEPFQITRDDDGACVLKGTKIARLFHMTDFTQDEAVRRFARLLREMGVDDDLRKRGAKDG